MRKTKIICTLGPSTDSPEILEAMMKSGMDVARFNFSHGTHEDHKRRLEMLKGLRKKTEHPGGRPAGHQGTGDPPEDL